MLIEFNYSEGFVVVPTIVIYFPTQVANYTQITLAWMGFTIDISF